MVTNDTIHPLQQMAHNFGKSPPNNSKRNKQKRGHPNNGTANIFISILYVTHASRMPHFLLYSDNYIFFCFLFQARRRWRWLTLCHDPEWDTYVRDPMIGYPIFEHGIGLNQIIVQ